MKDPEAVIVRFEEVAAKWDKLLSGVDRKDQAALTKIVKENLYDKIDVNAYGVELKRAALAEQDRPLRPLRWSGVFFSEQVCGPA